MELKNNTLFKETCFIGGKWIESDTGEKIKVDNPANGEIIGEVPKCSTSETQKAIKEAQAAFPSWRDKTAKERSVILQKWARLIEANADDLAKIMTIEQGKPLAEAKGEILMGVTYIDFYAEEGKRVYGDIIPDPMPDRRIVVIKQPVGVVGAITPWNFPSTMITRKCAPALAVGCTVVIKPASQTPYSALALGALAKEAGFPDGVVNVVTGYGNTVGTSIIENPDIRMISFTGSTKVGKIIVEGSAKNLKKTKLELGGKNPMVVFADSNLNEAADAAAKATFFNSGECCVSGSRILVEKKVSEEFVQKVLEKTKKIIVGDPLDEKTTIGPMI